MLWAGLTFDLKYTQTWWNQRADEAARDGLDMQREAGGTVRWVAKVTELM